MVVGWWCSLHISWIIDFFIAFILAGIRLFWALVFFLRRVVDLDVLLIVIVLDIIVDGFWIIVSIILWLGGIVGLVCILIVRHDDTSMQAGASAWASSDDGFKELPLAQVSGGSTAWIESVTKATAK